MANKQKTHKASAKVFKVKKNGTLTYKKSGRNHQPNEVASPKKVRQSRNKGILSKGEAKRLKKVI